MYQILQFRNAWQRPQVNNNLKLILILYVQRKGARYGEFAYAEMF